MFPIRSTRSLLHLISFGVCREVIEVKYFRTEGGVLYPPKEFTITVENRTLQEIISKAILEVGHA